MSGLTTALVGVDRSPASQPLLGCLPDLSEWGIRRIVLAHVMTVSYGQFGAFGHESHCRDWLEQQAETVAGAGFEVAVDVTVSGAPADELVAAAQRHGADLLVIGSRSHNLVRGLFLGGVARGVIGRSTVPVLIERIEPTAPETEQLCAAPVPGDPAARGPHRRANLGAVRTTGAPGARRGLSSRPGALRIRQLAAHADKLLVRRDSFGKDEPPLRTTTRGTRRCRPHRPVLAAPRPPLP